MIALLLLLSLVAFEEVLAATVACGKACLPGPGWGFIVGMVGGFLGIFCLITCCCMTCDNEEKNQEAETNLMTSTGTAEETGLSGKEKDDCTAGGQADGAYLQRDAF